MNNEELTPEELEAQKAQEGQDPNETDKDKAPRTFTEAQFATAVSAQVKAQVEAAKAEWDKEVAAKVSEAEKLAKLSKDERAKFQAEKEKSEFEKQKDELAHAQLAFEAKKQVVEAGLPETVLDMVVGADAEVTKANIDSFKTIFDDAVAKAVDAKLAGPKPKTGQSSTGDKDAFDDFFESRYK